MRYMVIEIGCLECSQGGDCQPETKVTTDSLDEARTAATKPRYSSEYDLFIVDTHTGSIITVDH